MTEEKIREVINEALKIKKDYPDKGFDEAISMAIGILIKKEDLQNV